MGAPDPPEQCKDLHKGAMRASGCCVGVFLILQGVSEGNWEGIYLVGCNSLDLQPQK